jgi:hypothetical protein
MPHHHHHHHASSSSSSLPLLSKRALEDLANQVRAAFLAACNANTSGPYKAIGYGASEQLRLCKALAREMVTLATEVCLYLYL